MKKPTPEEAAAWQRIIRLCDEILQPLPPPPADLLTYQQAASLVLQHVCTWLWTGNCRCENAQRWIQDHLLPAKKRVSCYSLKHDLDQFYQRHGSACYLRESDFAECLRRQGWVVRNGYVRAEVKP